MVRVGGKLGPFHVSSSTRQQRRGPSAAQAAALARQPRATNGALRLADVRTWFSDHWIWALLGLAVTATLPVIFGDGAAAETIWLGALTVGLVGWGLWIGRLHAAQAPAQRAAAAQAELARLHALADAALARQRADADAARLAADYAADMAPKQVGNAWHHGACTINHRTPDTAHRCRRG